MDRRAWREGWGCRKVSCGLSSLKSTWARGDGGVVLVRACAVAPALGRPSEALALGRPSEALGGAGSPSKLTSSFLKQGT